MNYPLPRAACFQKLLFLACLILPASSTTSFVLRGRVTDPTGAAVPRVSVLLVSQDQIREGVTDAEGRFQFGEVSPDTYELDVKAQGFRRELLTVRITDKNIDGVQISLRIGTGGGPCVVPMEHPMAVPVVRSVAYVQRSSEFNLTGTILESSSGSPVASAKIALSPSDKGRVAISDAQGHFRFADLEPGQYQLSLSKDASVGGNVFGSRVVTRPKSSPSFGNHRHAREAE